jgi:nicotinamide-nucleotide amidase
MARCEILAIGTEMLSGDRQDTNSVWLRRELRELALQVVRVTQVGDDLADIVAALQEALSRAELVVATGGLGPTEDDCTLAAVARAAGREQVLSREIHRGLEERASRAGRIVTESALRQAMVPARSRVYPNARGTAPGLAVETAGKLLVVLPGVPDEMKGIYREQVAADLRARFDPCGLSRGSLLIAGRWESEVDDAVAGPCEAAGVDRTILASAGIVELHLTGSEPAVRQAVEAIRRDLGADVISSTGASLPEVVVEAARERRGALSVAESCTGGRVAALLTGVPGASEVFGRGYVVYSDDAKVELLGVDRELLRRHGAVSRPSVEAMLAGLMERSRCRWGLAVTGIAGPGGGSPSKPVGTVWLAAGGPAGARVIRRSFPGSRPRVQEAAARIGLDLLRRVILQEEPA